MFDVYLRKISMNNIPAVGTPTSQPQPHPPGTPFPIVPQQQQAGVAVTPAPPPQIVAAPKAVGAPRTGQATRPSIRQHHMPPGGQLLMPRTLFPE